MLLPLKLRLSGYIIITISCLLSVLKVVKLLCAHPVFLHLYAQNKLMIPPQPPTQNTQTQVYKKQTILDETMDAGRGGS
jgi:hypothetical protein